MTVPRIRVPQRWRNYVYRSRYQVGFAVAAGALLAVVAPTVTGKSDFSTFPSRVEYAAFTLGVASILALVASITFGFLLYSLQSIKTDKIELYGRFKDGVRSLRRFLDEQFEAGWIDESYDYAFGLLDEVTLDQFPLLGPAWTERVDPIVENVTEDQRAFIETAGGDFGVLLRGFAYRINDVEETVQGLTVNWLGYLSLTRMVGTVVKAFRTLALVLVVVLVSAVYYQGALRFALWAAAIGLGVMTLLLIVEMTMVARRESGGLYPEPAKAAETDDADDLEAEVAPSGPATSPPS